LAVGETGLSQAGQMGSSGFGGGVDAESGSVGEEIEFGRIDLPASMV
jgi:hypothetical protein